jgi:hypothetical protein
MMPRIPKKGGTMAHRTALRLFLAILSASILWLIPFDENGHAQESNDAELHWGEDGVSYPREMQMNRSGWLLGKIEPVILWLIPFDENRESNESLG